MVDCRLCWNECGGLCFSADSEYKGENVSKGVESCLCYDGIEILEPERKDNEQNR